MKTSTTTSRTSFYRCLGLTLLMLLTAGCSGGDKADNTDNAGIAVEGLVRDAAHQRLDGVEVFDANGVLAVSDADGRMQFRLPEGSTGPLRLRKPGYAAQTVPLQVMNGQADFEATLGRRGPVISIDPSQPVDVAGTHGARVTLPANALVDGNGNPVSGEVELTITPVDVSSDDEMGVFPGAFAGEDADGTTVPLILSYGTVEYRFTQDGEELNLAEGQSAEIELPVFVEQHPDGSPVQIGDTGALWYLNEETGLWKQEGSGTVVASLDSPTGLALQARVEHFSWWNHDVAPATCDLTINISGLPSGTEFVLKGQTQTPGPRSATTVVSSGGDQYITPRDNPVRLSSTVKTQDGVYRANQTTTCNGVADTTTLAFSGPEAPVIYYFEGRTKPKFGLELDPDDPSTTRWVLEGQDAIFDWVVAFADQLTLSSDQGHETTLGNDSGSVQFPLELNGSHANEYQFTLLAETVDGGVDSITRTLPYDTGEPYIYKADSWQDFSDENVQAAALSWEVEGADSLQIWAGIYDDVEPLLLYEDNDPPQTGDVAINTVESIFSSLGAGQHSVVLLFTNQYGTSEARVDVSVYDPNLFCMGGKSGRGGTAASSRGICE